MKTKNLIRILAIVLAILLAGGMVVGALISALAEEPTEVGNARRNQYTISMEYMPDEQALHITQRLIYTNPSQSPLKAVVFYAAGNMFRRESALMYDPGDLETVFFAGFAPAGIDLRAVRFNGEPADYGFQGEDELYVRVDCDLAGSASGSFEFDYYLLLMNCGAFQGVGDTDVRLSAFYLAPGPYIAHYGEFNPKRPLAHTRWLDTAAADFDVTLTLPEGYVPAGTGEIRREGEAWRITTENARDFAISFGRRWRTYERDTASGVRIRLLTNARGTAGGRWTPQSAPLTNANRGSATSRCQSWTSCNRITRWAR